MTGDLLELKYEPLDDLLAARVPDNPKDHDIPGIQLSIRRRAYNAPVTRDERSGRVVAGHGRLEALDLMRAAGESAPRHIALRADGMWMVPVVRGVSFETEADFYEYLVSDNALAIARGWEEERMAPIIQRLHEARVPLAALGHTQEVIDRYLAGRDRSGDDDDEVTEQLVSKADELAKEWGTARGQIWVVPSATAPGLAHRIMCGDSTSAEDVAALFGGKKASWMWTDPPYGVEMVSGPRIGTIKARKKAGGMSIMNDQRTDVRKIVAPAFANADAHLEDGAALYVCHPAGDIAPEFGLIFIEAGWRLHQCLVWVKESFVLGHSDYHYQHEPILYGWKGKSHTWYGDRKQTTVFTTARPSRNTLHPTMKPVSLITSMIVNSSVAGSLGYEPFSGSGSTALAAESQGRVVCAMELDPRFCAVTLERLRLAGLRPALQ